MTTSGCTVFETALGHCAIAWAEDRVLGAQLPEGDEQRARARMRGRFPQAREADPPPAARQAIDGVRALLRGEPSDLTAVPLDMTEVPDFHRKVYELAREIPPGRTRTYGEIAQSLGVPGSARAVGQALGSNPFAPIVPCHRVLAAGGKVGGFSARGGTDTKRRLLEIEGVYLEEPTLF
ncbi:methylated-DNA--[protein]-cysteine S-methyltransferase [Amycolatopsis cihanbeyliensis]|uniref:methylated-DNA--[protein]-cysteine S-methyltransferase n=1 Tax=Amycolatopsis cihanbeyliensis TaxID=1128664 RepID=A0A542DPE7_AMYCI|nr:methylated-DNA--[protein]-cysteine S-methyltransferase [Amycolatopsis cihanbeyliensis]TQJ04970.1 methylated-DNA-[protein]-cysteine S-methyltransferase [Amycolatopsis cihanbeyliensis]